MGVRGGRDPRVHPAGPLFVDDTTATIDVPRGWLGQRDPNDNLVLQRESAALPTAALLS
jgi:hypothetical protein